MKKKHIAAVGVTMVTAISVLTGAYAYFTDKKSIELTASAAKLGIIVDKSNFTDDLVNNMIPGDSREISYTVTNSGEADAMVFTEITLVSSVPMADTVEWFIQDAENSVKEEDRMVDPEMSGKDFYDDVTISDLKESNIKFVSLTDNNKVAKFVVNNGVIKAGENSKPNEVDLKLMLGINAGTSFMDSICNVTANVYAIQNQNTEDTLTWEFIKDTAEANEVIETA